MAIKSKDLRKQKHRVPLVEPDDTKTFEAALREGEERFRRLLHDVQAVAVQGYGPDGTTHYWNQASEQLYGYSAQEAIGHNVVDLIIPPEMRGEVEQAIEQMSTTGQPIPASELSLMRKDGSRVAVFSSHTIVQIPGRMPELFCIDIDLTGCKRTEEALRGTLHELGAQQIELEAQNEELRRTQTELDATRARYFDLYNLAPVGYCTLSEQGMIQEANLSAATLLGVARSALINEPFSRFILKEDRDIYHLHRQQNFENGEPSVCELRMAKQEGTVFWVYLATTALQQAGGGPEYRVVMSDITDRKRAEEALRQSEQRRRLAQEAANAQLEEQTEYLTSIYQALDSIGLIVSDLEESDARIATLNSGAEKMFGYRQDEVAGKSITLIYPPEFMEMMPARIKKLKQGKALHALDVTLVRKSGDRFPAVVSVHPFASHGGRYSKVVGVIRDISELMRMQAQLEAINIELEQRVEQRTLELQETQKQYLHAEKLSAIGKLSASIAHEFNNPLQGILSILKGLKKRAILEEEDRELLDAAINESERIKDLIRSLKDFNRPSTGRKAVMDVHKSLDSVLLLHKSDFKGKRITVVRDYAEQLPQILAIPDQIKQVFLNLLTNAADACSQPDAVITISTRQENDHVAVAIKDTGIGIKPAEMEQIFQPFFTTKPEVKGTGLGLSVSYGIVKHHQGEIRVDSQPGEGATFTVLLPIRNIPETGTADSI